MKRKQQKSKKLEPLVGKHYFLIKDSIFHRPVHVLLNHTRKDYEKWMIKRGVTKEELSSSGDTNFMAWSSVMSSSDKPDEWIIFVKDFDWTIKDQGSLIHEITHTVMKIFSANNIPFQLETQEFIAHSIGNMYEDICRQIFKKKKRG